jgi:hypothetical protein
MSALRSDLLRSLDEISEYTGEPTRRIRYLISRYNFPCKRVGNKIQSRKSWVDRYYAEPDRVSAGAD